MGFASPGVFHILQLAWHPLNSAAGGGGEGHLQRTPPPRIPTHTYHHLKRLLVTSPCGPALVILRRSWLVVDGFGMLFLFSSVACFIFSSLAFLLALEELHPLKLDEVGFCVVHSHI